MLIPAARGTVELWTHRREKFIMRTDLQAGTDGKGVSGVMGVGNEVDTARFCAEREEAERTVWLAPVVSSVDNRITINY
jgi:hypothetical protein